MWLFTKFGFFSIVRKHPDGPLTVRSRTRGDLDRLRTHYLPALSPSLPHQGSDYPWRATVDGVHLAQAMGQIVSDMDYDNFKDEVAQSLGVGRAKRYSKIWSALYDMPEDLPEICTDGDADLPWPKQVSGGKAIAYGGVVIDPQGNLLLRHVKNHFDGYVWTYAKGRPDPGETPRETALREVTEEMGVRPTLLTTIPGEFIGGTTVNRFFLMVTDRNAVDLAFDCPETAGLCWATPDEALDRFTETTNQQGRLRDIAILEATQACLVGTRQARIAQRTDQHTQPMPAKRTTLPLEMRYTLAEMADIQRGIVPSTPLDPWFVFYEDGVLHCHKDDSGYCIYRVYFRLTHHGSEAWQVEINRHPGQHDWSDDREDLRVLEGIVENLLLTR
jgi:8-oxo-dGTP pyrophosphatase MutT (NUDIX family)